MKITPYKQSLSHSCLVAGLLMLEQEQKSWNFTKTDEQRIALKGSQRTYPFYMVGVATEVVKECKGKMKVFVDNKYFTDVLTTSFKNKNIKVEHQKVTPDFIRKLVAERPVVCHIDTHGLGDFSHSSHFIVLEEALNNMFTIIDPWDGKRKKVIASKLEKAITDLKNHVKMAPLLFQLM